MKKNVAIVLLATSMLFSGCTALVIGGAAAGGYAVAKDERTTKQIAADASITGSVKSKLLADKYVKGFAIDVDTYNSIVTLTGELTSNFSKERAAEIASNTRGVIQVKNNLTIVK